MTKNGARTKTVGKVGSLSGEKLAEELERALQKEVAIDLTGNIKVAMDRIEKGQQAIDLIKKGNNLAEKEEKMAIKMENLAIKKSKQAMDLIEKGRLAIDLVKKGRLQVVILDNDQYNRFSHYRELAKHLLDGSL